MHTAYIDATEIKVVYNLWLVKIRAHTHAISCRIVTVLSFIKYYMYMYIISRGKVAFVCIPEQCFAITLIKLFLLCFGPIWTFFRHTTIEVAGACVYPYLLSCLPVSALIHVCTMHVEVIPRVHENG